MSTVPCVDAPPAPTVHASSPAAERSGSWNLEALFGLRTRGAFFAFCILLLFANGGVRPAFQSVLDLGLAAALFNTFRISAVVWIAGAAIIALVLRDERPAISRADRIAGLLCVAAAALPLSQASWVAATGLALYLLFNPRAKRDGRRTGILLLALTGSMLWGRLLLNLGGDSILEGDARMVGLITGMPTSGNMVRTVGGDGWIWIAQPCSSLSNMSLALLCSVLVICWRGLAWDRERVLRCILACAVVVLINDVRISMLVFLPDKADMIHGIVGDTVASWVMMGAILFVCLWRNQGPRGAVA